VKRCAFDCTAREGSQHTRTNCYGSRGYAGGNEPIAGAIRRPILIVLVRKGEAYRELQRVFEQSQAEMRLLRLIADEATQRQGSVRA
jgi:hypothetical protein